MDEYLSKPVHSNELIQVIAKLLDQQEKTVAKHPPAPEKLIDIDYALTLVGNDTDLLLTSCNAIVKYLPLKMTELNQAVSKKEYQRVTRLAHSIKTTAKSVGNRKLTRIAFAMEQSGNENKVQRAVKLMPFFNLHVQNMLNELEDYILSADQDISLS